jgi:dipeptidase D
MSNAIANLEPKALWGHFADLCAIPRPSGKEERVRAHVKAWAAARSFEVREDSVGNLCVAVPASKGHERAPIVILQGHLDIVAEKNNDFAFDFDKDPIPATIDGEWVTSKNTTLGADNGMGIAAAMASADDPTAMHGPLELLFTVDEETALTGATNLDPRIVQGRTLLNLDSEEDGTLFVGCAGGATTEIDLPAKRAAAAGRTALALTVTGLKGGHSGLCIHENRGNSIKVLARVLHLWLEKAEVLIDSIQGGNKHNAIPREASAVVLVPSGFVAEARTLAEELRRRALTEIATIDPGLEIGVTPAAKSSGKPADADSSRRLVQLLVGLPHGVIAMSRELAGLTETSTNLAIIQTDADGPFHVTTSSRSSVEAALRFTLDQANALILLAGGKLREVNAYPGWQPNMASKLLATCKKVHHELRGNDAKVTAIHAGLECGIIGEKLGGADMISFGPWLEGVHAPGERVNVPSAARFWEFHKALLRSLAG